LAGSRQERLGRAGVALSGALLCAFVGFEVGQELSLAANGGVHHHSSIARAEADLGAEGKAAINALIIKTAEEQNCAEHQAQDECGAG
jgi:hypothetical protein